MLKIWVICYNISDFAVGGMSMAFSELIKNFSKIREYMSQFFVYGFKSRSEYDQKSARSYDNEKRRIESWLGDYMCFRQGADGKNVFIALDSRNIPSNPLYKAFKAKSFTANDINLHFLILDILTENSELSASEITDRLSADYFTHFENAKEPDVSTVRKKLREYEKLGILTAKKQGNQLLYSKSNSDIELENLKDAIQFYSEISPMGVVGSYLLDRFESTDTIFYFKHHYILHILESEVLYLILQAIGEQRQITVENFSTRTKNKTEHTVVPFKIRVSVTSGRRYLVCYHIRFKKMMTFRLDSIKSVKSGEVFDDYNYFKEKSVQFSNHLWGVSSNDNRSTEHIEMVIYVANNEKYIIDRLYREKRSGTVARLDSNHYKFTADVYDVMEMTPWIRSFYGRIVSLESSNKELKNKIIDDVNDMVRLYGGDENAL